MNFNTKAISYKKHSRSNLSILISFFFVSLLIQPALNIVAGVEAIFIIYLISNKKLYKISGRELSVSLVLFITGGGAFLYEGANSNFFTYWHYCIIMPTIMYLIGKVINEAKIIDVIYTISFICLIIMSLSIYLTPTNIQIKDKQWTDEHTRMFRFFYAEDTVFNGTGVIIYLIPSFSIFFIDAKKFIYKVVKIVTAIFLFYCIYKSESRSALYFVALIGLYYYNRKVLSRRTFLIGLIVAIGLVVIIFFGDEISNLIPERFSLSYTQKTGLTSRDLIWGAALLEIGNSFWGNPSPYMEVLGQTFSPHNNFLLYWLLFGWINGLFATITFIYIEIYVLRRIIKKNSAYKYLGYIMTGLFINFSVEAASIAMPFTFAFYALLAGFSYKILSKKIVETKYS